MTENQQPSAYLRMERAEQAGLRLAIICRTAVTAAALIWIVGASVFYAAFEPRLAAIAALLLFTALGVAHLLVIGTAHDRWWLKYAIYTADTLGICALFALIPISRSEEIPQIIAFRAYGIYYLFPILAMACLSLSWRLVLWTGTVAVFGWWAAFAWVVAGMEKVYSWGDIPADASRQDYETIFLSIDFIGRGNRVEETGLLFAGAAILALAVYRARQVFFAQIAAEAAEQAERGARQRVTDLLGRYIPESVARKLVENPAALAPQIRSGTALILDIAGFTRFAATRSPDAVIAELDSFLSEASDAVSRHGGVVITFTGDGLLATFNAPLEHSRPRYAAVTAARDLLDIAGAAGLGVRIGIASGEIVSGNIGSSKRQAFTVYGDAVNLSARLEALGKPLGQSLLIDGQTRIGLKEDMAFRSLGMQTIRGMDAPVEVFTLAGNG